MGNSKLNCLLDYIRFHGDTSRTFMIGEVDKKGCDLVYHAHKALMAGINVCEPFGSVLDIGYAIK